MNSDLSTRLAGRRVVASVSGGKDSAAMSLYLHELGIEHDRVFMDTGWEHQATYDYLRGPLTKAIGPITEIRSKTGGLEEIIRKKGMLPSRVRRFCTEEAKVFPMRDHIASIQDAGEECLNTVGIRAAESASRAKMPEWEESDTFDCTVWRPILRWTDAEVVAIHKRHGLPPNPLYLMGATRVGCWPCIFARKAEIRLIADKDPERIDRLRALESEVAIAAEARYWRDLPDRLAKAEAAGEPVPRPFSPPSWFQARTGGGGLCWPIDKVVEWSRTSRGGVQYDMFAADPADEGCMRWGMCETDAGDASWLKEVER